MESQQPAVRLVRLPEVLAAVGISRSEWYRLIGIGQAPAPVPLSVRSRAWVSSEVKEFIDQRIAARDQRRALNHG